jgi:hypothetical protein
MIRYAINGMMMAGHTREFIRIDDLLAGRENIEFLGKPAVLVFNDGPNARARAEQICAWLNSEAWLKREAEASDPHAIR